MKELSIEEKAKRYDKAIERAKAYQGLRSEMEIIFPELKESEDEQIRKKDVEDLKHNPARWTPEKRIEKYIEYLHIWKHDDRVYSDDYRVYQEYNAFMDRFHKLKKALSPEEMEEAYSLYREIYNEEVKMP